MRELTFFGHATTQGGVRTPADFLMVVEAIILRGNWSTGLLTNGHRHSLNFVGADWMAFDVDGGLSLSSAQDIMRTSGLAHVIGTTASHQKAKGDKPPADRYRIVVRLATRIIDPAVWRATYDGLAARLGLPADPQARDAVRYWKPCKTIAVSKDGADVVPVEPRQDDEDPGERPTGLLYDLPRAAADAKNHPPAVAGEGGSNVLWDLALRLVRGYGLPVDIAVEVLLRHYNQRCVPPWSEEELRHKCQDAEANGKAAWGYMFYRGLTTDILRRALRRYGPAGTAGVYYRVWPDGRMQRLDDDVSMHNAIIDINLTINGDDPPMDQVRTARDWWEMHSDLTGPVPASVVLGSSREPALVRLQPEDGPTPAWDEFLNRCDIPEYVLAWLAMLCGPQATRQALWLQGEGLDGKSVVAAALTEIFGQAAITVTDEDMASEGAKRFLGGSLFGRRLVACDDTKKLDLLKQGLMHRVTGRGPLTCDRKGETPFTFAVDCALLVTSNYEPAIGRNRADSSRLILVHVRNKGVVSDTSWKARLVEEFPRLLRRALLAYDRLAVSPGEPALRLEGQALKNIEGAHETDDASFLDTLEKMFLSLDPAGEITSKQWSAGMDSAHLSPHRDWQTVQALKRWLASRGVVSFNRGGKRGFSGLKASGQ
jgi:hypothetical protein